MDAQAATLTTETLVGKVELDHPQRGIHRLRFGELSLSGWLLGITSVEKVIDGNWELIDSYSRGNDLVADYCSLAGEPVSKQVYWTIHPQTSRQNPLQIDVVASVQTELLQSYPRITVSTQLQCEAILFSSNHGDGRESVDDLGASDSGSWEIETPGCAIYRFLDVPWSYVEMAHPADFCRWRGSSVEGGSWQSRWDIENRFLEKGVIRRFQLRGALLPRQNDLLLARQLFAKFAAKKPPLTV